MAKIPYSEGTGNPEITSESVGPTINPGMFGLVDEAAARAADTLGTKLIDLQNAQDVTKGSLDIEQHLNNVQQSILESNDYKSYGNTLDAEVGKLTEGINGNYSGQVKTELLNRLAAQKITRSHQLDAWAYGQTIDSAKQTMTDNATEALRNVAYGSGSERQMYKTAFLQDVDAHTGTLYSAAEAKELKRSFGQQADFGAAVTDIQSNPIQAGKNLKDIKQYSDITSEQRAQLQNEADRRTKENKSMSEAGLKGQMDDALARGAVTGVIPPGITARVAATGDKDLISNWNDSVNATRLYHDTAMKMMSGNVNDIPSIIQSFSPGGLDQMTGKKIAGVPSTTLSGIKSFGTQQKLYTMLQQLGTQIQTTAIKDPASLTWQTSSQGLDVNHQLGEIIDRNTRLLTDKGVAARDPLPSQVSDQMAADISRSNPAERVARLQVLEANAGPHFDDVMRQMAPNLPPSTAFYNSVSGGTYKTLAANDIMPIGKMIESLGPKDNGVFTGIDTDARTQFEGIAKTLPGNPQQTSGLFETFEKLAISYQMQGITDPVTKARQDLFDNAYSFDGNWRFPKGVDSDQIEKYASHKLGMTTGFATADGEPDEMARARFQAANNWVYKDGPTQNGVATPGTYWLRDDNGQQVYTNDGKPVMFSIPQAMLWTPDPNADANPALLRNVQRAH